MELSNETWYLSLVNILSTIYEEPIQHQPCLGMTAMINNNDLDLYIRLLGNYKLTIARISVGADYERKGIGSKILEWSINFCIEYGIQKVVVESALTNGSIEFCKKHGMRKDIYSLDWSIEIS